MNPAQAAGQDLIRVCSTTRRRHGLRIIRMLSLIHILPDRHIRSYLDFMSMPTGEQNVTPMAKQAAASYFRVTDDPKEADVALCFIESPISVGYDPKDREDGGNGYVPVTLQYRPYEEMCIRDRVNYVQMHYKEHITLENLAQHTYLSKTYISRSFTKYFGVSFTEYVTLLRLTAAGKMICGEKTLAETAYESGFPNANAMIHAFKYHYGITPGEYRKQRLQGAEPEAVQQIVRQEESRDLFVSLLKYAAVSYTHLDVYKRQVWKNYIFLPV